MTAYSLPKLVFQISGVASVLAGILLICGFILHPAGEDPTFGTDPLWVPAPGSSWAALTIALLGWIGLYISQASRAGGPGTIAFVVTIFETSLASGIFSSGVTYVPVLAAQAPELFPRLKTRRSCLAL